MNDIEKTLEQLSRDVGRFNTNNNTVVQNIKSSIQNPFKLNLISICVFIFFSIIIFLYFAKPNFIMIEIKDEPVIGSENENKSSEIVENLEKKSVKELKLIAKEKGIKNYSTMLKNDLLKLIKSHTI